MWWTVGAPVLRGRLLHSTKSFALVQDINGAGGCRNNIITATTVSELVQSLTLAEWEEWLYIPS